MPLFKAHTHIRYQKCLHLPNLELFETTQLASQSASQSDCLLSDKKAQIRKLSLTYYFSLFAAVAAAASKGTVAKSEGSSRASKRKREREIVSSEARHRRLGVLLPVAIAFQ